LDDVEGQGTARGIERDGPSNEMKGKKRRGARKSKLGGRKGGRVNVKLGGTLKFSTCVESKYFL